MTHLKTTTLAALFLAAFFILAHTLDGPSDMQAEADTALAVSDLADWHAALAQQQAQQPERWSAEQRARAHTAALIAQGAKP